MTTWQFIFTDGRRSFHYEATAETQHAAMLKARAMLFLAHGNSPPRLSSEYLARERTPLHLTTTVDLEHGEYRWEPLAIPLAA